MMTDSSLSVGWGFVWGVVVWISSTVLGGLTGWERGEGLSRVPCFSRLFARAEPLLQFVLHALDEFEASDSFRRAYAHFLNDSDVLVSTRGIPTATLDQCDGLMFLRIGPSPRSSPSLLAMARLASSSSSSVTMLMLPLASR